MTEKLLFRQFFAHLRAVVKENLTSILPDLHTIGVITGREEEGATNEENDLDSRVNSLMKSLEIKIDEKPSHFTELLHVCSSNGANVKVIIDKYEEAIERESSASRRSSYSCSDFDTESLNKSASSNTSKGVSANGEVSVITSTPGVDTSSKAVTSNTIVKSIKTSKSMELFPTNKPARPSMRRTSASESAVSTSSLRSTTSSSPYKIKQPDSNRRGSWDEGRSRLISSQDGTYHRRQSVPNTHDKLSSSFNTISPGLRAINENASSPLNFRRPLTDASFAQSIQLESTSTFIPVAPEDEASQQEPHSICGSAEEVQSGLHGQESTTYAEDALRQNKLPRFTTDTDVFDEETRQLDNFTCVLTQHHVGSIIDGTKQIQYRYTALCTFYHEQCKRLEQERENLKQQNSKLQADLRLQRRVSKEMDDKIAGHHVHEANITSQLREKEAEVEELNTRLERANAELTSMRSQKNFEDKIEMLAEGQEQVDRLPSLSNGTENEKKEQKDIIQSIGLRISRLRTRPATT